MSQYSRICDVTYSNLICGIRCYFMQRYTGERRSVYLFTIRLLIGDYIKALFNRFEKE